jgi:hypothetical protein
MAPSYTVIMLRLDNDEAAMVHTEPGSVKQPETPSVGETMALALMDGNVCTLVAGVTPVYNRVTFCHRLLSTAEKEP